jgi:D-alanyl-D-alanine carboxypeptidase/D-alanyl-D-alanine-endopeptidase (penicillin-binding protein 4)
MPASNQKLLTTATALDVLGSEYRYETTLYFRGEVEESVMRGDMILEGAGDPTLGSSAMRTENPLRAWARELAASGVTRIEGRLIGDDNAFDDSPYAEGWDISYIANESFAPANSGLSLGDNVVSVQIQADRIGNPPLIRADPPDYLTIDNQIVTSARRRGRNVDIQRMIGTERVRLTGSVPRVYRSEIKIPVSNPTLATLHGLKLYLESAGIEVAATLVDVDDLPGGLRYRGADPLFVYHSPPLREILKVINKESNNFYAEQVFRTFSWGGSADGGERRVKAFLSGAGIATAGLSIRDGSGLSRKDMVTPETSGPVLAFMNRHPERGVFFDALARGGERETTLDYRLRGVPISAKTGSLEFVRALSGYATTRDGRLIAFSLLANNYTVPPYRIMQAMDRVVLAITTAEDV